MCPEQSRHKLLPSTDKVERKRKIHVGYNLNKFELVSKKTIRGCNPGKSTLQQHETGKMEISKLCLEIIVSFTEVRSIIIC